MFPGVAEKLLDFRWRNEIPSAKGGNWCNMVVFDWVFVWVRKKYVRSSIRSNNLMFLLIKSVAHTVYFGCQTTCFTNLPPPPPPPNSVAFLSKNTRARQPNDILRRNCMIISDQSKLVFIYINMSVTRKFVDEVQQRSSNSCWKLNSINWSDEPQRHVIIRLFLIQSDLASYYSTF